MGPFLTLYRDRAPENFFLYFFLSRSGSRSLGPPCSSLSCSVYCLGEGEWDQDPQDQRVSRRGWTEICWIRGVEESISRF